MSRIMCFKPTRKVHESGYRYIEYGYMSVVDGKEHVEIVGQYDLLQTPYNEACPFHLDLTKSGWFRILPRKSIKLDWSYGGEITILNPDLATTTKGTE